MEEQVRRARIGDLPRVRELLTGHDRHVLGQRHGELAALLEGEQAAMPDAALDDPERLVLVAELDGVPLGAAAARVLAIGEGRRLALLEGCYVEPGARGVGLGEALAAEVVRWAVEKGCGGIDAPASPGDRHAKNFLEANGFAARRIVMHRPLP